MYTAIMKTENGRISKLQDGFSNAAKAQKHVDKHNARFPDAFVVTTPDAPVDWWLVEANNVVTISKPAPKPKRPKPDRDAAIRALIAGDAVAAQAAMDRME